MHVLSVLCFEWQATKPNKFQLNKIKMPKQNKMPAAERTMFP